MTNLLSLRIELRQREQIANISYFQISRMSYFSQNRQSKYIILDQLEVSRLRDHYFMQFFYFSVKKTVKTYVTCGPHDLLEIYHALFKKKIQDDLHA